MSDTPITNANTWTTICGNLKGAHSENEDELYVPASVSRKLERELNAAKADAESWRDQAERFGRQIIEAHDTVTRMRLAISHSQNEICQTAGMALGYPWFKDDQKNFPDATEHDGVCIGEHVAETIVAELASRYAEANERIKQLESDQKQSMSRIMRMEVAGDNLVVCATCDVSDASQFVSAWRRSKK